MLTLEKPAPASYLTPEAKEVAELAETLLAGWKETHGTPHGKISAMTGTDAFAVLIDEAFSQAELTLAKRSDGQSLLQRYVEHLMQQVCPHLAAQVEQTVGRRVASTSVSPNPRAGWIICLFKFEKVRGYPPHLPGSSN